MRWFLIDRFTDIKPHTALIAHKLISHNEAYFEDHFPWGPVFPSSLLLEMMAQAGGVLAGISLGFTRDVILGKVEKAEFLRAVVPPSSVTIQARIAAEDTGSAWAEMELSDEAGLAAVSRILFVFLDAPAPGGRGSVVFTDNFLETYKLMEFKSGQGTVSRSSALQGAYE